MSLEREFQLKQEVESLRQQLADRDEQISDLTISSDTYFAERNSARDVWRRASKDRDELRQQLAAALAACKAKNEQLSLLLEWCVCQDSKFYQPAAEALAIQPDDSALKAWLGEPAAFIGTHHGGIKGGDYRKLFWSSTVDGWVHEFEPLYAPKGLK